MSVSVTETSTVLGARQEGFRGAARPPHPPAPSLKRRLASPHRTPPHQLRAPCRARSPTRETSQPTEDGARTLADLEYRGSPDSTYIRRMVTFHDRPAGGWGLTGGGMPDARGAHPARRRSTVDGLLPDDQRCNREVRVCGDRRIRWGWRRGKALRLWGGLIDGRPSPRHRDRRERALLSSACDLFDSSSTVRRRLSASST